MTLTVTLDKPRWLRLPRPSLRPLARLLEPAKPVLANLAKIPFTIAGWACIDVGVFYANTIAGFIITGITLMIIEHQIADER